MKKRKEYNEEAARNAAMTEKEIQDAVNKKIAAMSYIPDKDKLAEMIIEVMEERYEKELVKVLKNMN